MIDSDTFHPSEDWDDALVALMQSESKMSFSTEKADDGIRVIIELNSAMLKNIARALFSQFGHDIFEEDGESVREDLMTAAILDTTVASYKTAVGFD